MNLLCIEWTEESGCSILYMKKMELYKINNILEKICDSGMGYKFEA